MTEYQNQLVLEHMSTVDWVIRHRIRVTNLPLQSYEDFYQIGCEALCKAATAYDPKSGAFTPFAGQSIYNAIIDHCRKENLRMNGTIDVQGISDSDNLSLRYLSEAGDMCTPIWDKELLTALREAKERYSGIAQRGIEAIELKAIGFSSGEIAAHYGTTVNNLNAWISRARQRLKSDAGFLRTIE